MSGRRDFGTNFGKNFAEIRPAIDRFKGIDFEMTGQRAVGSYTTRSVEVAISQYLIRFDFKATNYKLLVSRPGETMKCMRAGGYYYYYYYY